MSEFLNSFVETVLFVCAIVIAYRRGKHDGIFQEQYREIRRSHNKNGLNIKLRR